MSGVVFQLLLTEGSRGETHLNPRIIQLACLKMLASHCGDIHKLASNPGGTQKTNAISP